MKNLVLLSLFFGLGGNFLLAQTNFEFAYNTGRNDQARAIVQCPDSGFAVIGSTVNYNNNTDVYLLKTDVAGQFLWAKRMGTEGLDGGEDIISLSDGGFGVIGFTQKNGNYDLYFIRLDENGDTLFSRTFGGVDWDFGKSLQPTSDNGFILAGNTFVNNKSKAYLVKLDSMGNLIWEKTFGGAQNSAFEKIIIAANGDYLLAGESNSYGNGKQAYIVRTDTSGALIWQSTYGNPGEDFAKSILELSNGDIVFAGATNTVPYPDLDNWGAKISSTGAFIQENIVFDFSLSTPFIQNDDWNEFVIAQNDSILFGGTRNYNNVEEGNIYLFRYNQDISYPSGYRSDFQKFIIHGEDIAYDAKQTHDKGVIIACTAKFLDSSSSSIYLIKMDSSRNWPLPFSNSIQFQNDYTSITEKENEWKMSIFPNPANSYFTISHNHPDTKGTIRILNMSGKLVETRSKLSASNRIDVSSWESGVYFVTVETNQQLITKKIVIAK